MSIRLIVAQKTNPRPLLAGHECLATHEDFSCCVLHIPRRHNFFGRGWSLQILRYSHHLKHVHGRYMHHVYLCMLSLLQGMQLDTPTILVNVHTIWCFTYVHIQAPSLNCMYRNRNPMFLTLNSRQKKATTYQRHGISNVHTQVPYQWHCTKTKFQITYPLPNVWKKCVYTMLIHISSTGLTEERAF